ncbi:IQ domain-containing protein E isoform X2 [Rhineura floridana]|uniref:IQ domain-containing protein E isoform X2 n=1 Tax=Rhineura floridana TaxID=261503 RepID=UPI002AC85D6B|nr:IQ domain-containing protein E isoform X2 [Rhineura floridana]
MSQSPSETATERDLAEDSLSAITYESDTETKLKKKTSRKPPKSPKSPYTSSTCLHSKKAGFLRTFKGTDSQHFEIPLVKSSRQVWRGSFKQGAWMSQVKSGLDVGPVLATLSGSTPEYLKEALGMRKPKHARSASSGYIPGTPDYKEKEDMYDEIIELKKTIQAQKCEADRMKTKLRRLEEENNRKDKQIEQLLDPSRCSEFGWVRTEQKSDTSLMLNGLKQKILKLEQQCKEKDNTINKLQTDVKSTNVEEMRISLQTYYEEIQRLQTLLAKSKAVQRKYYRYQVKDQEEEENIERSEEEEREREKGLCHQRKTGGLWSSRSPESKQQKVLSTAVLQLSRSIKELQDENRELKADLDHALSGSPASSKAKNYTEWSRQRLVRRISKLEKKMDEMQNSRLQLSETYTPPLVFAPLDQSVAKECDLLEECERLRRVVNKLKGQRVVLQNQLAVKEEEIQKLTEKVRKLEEKQEAKCRLAGIGATEPPSQGLQKFHSGRQQLNPVCMLNLMGSNLEVSSPCCPEHHRKEQAAQVIQRQWKTYKSQNPRLSFGSSSSQTAADCKAEEEAVRLIQSVFRAHIKRTQLEERPLNFSPGSGRTSPAPCSREKEQIWSPFKCSPLVFTSAAHATSTHDRLQPSPSPPAEEVHSDDSDDIITVSPSPVKKTLSLDFTSRLSRSVLHS